MFNFVLALVVSLSLSGSGVVQADPIGGDAVKKLYKSIKSTLEHPTPSNPFYLKAENKHHIESAEAALYFPQKLNEIADSLELASNWCEILPLHMNVKGCTYSHDGKKITIYLGRKFYQNPDDAYQLTYKFNTVRKENYFAAIVVADRGPLGTSDYHIEFEVITVDGTTFGRIHLSDHQSWISAKALNIYLATKGADKEGIKVTGHDEQGNPMYTTGKTAVAERNLLRYYFAFTAFFENSSEVDDRKRHEEQINAWFDQTEKYPQLYEISREEYQEEKRKERINQLALQENL